jgi:hypothetical protein
MLDLSLLLDFGASMKSYISGYIGTDTMPMCDKGICWYLYEMPFAITQE